MKFKLTVLSILTILVVLLVLSPDSALASGTLNMSVGAGNPEPPGGSYNIDLYGLCGSCSNNVHVSVTGGSCGGNSLISGCNNWRWRWPCTAPSTPQHVSVNGWSDCGSVPPQSFDVVACDTGLSCSGSCSAPSNTCATNNGSRGGCVYTIYSGGGSCVQVSAPNQTCTVNNCLSGYTCSNGSCIGGPQSTTTNPATNVTCSGATLNGSSNPNGAGTTGWFRYSSTNPGSCNDSFGTRIPASGGFGLGAGTSSVSYSLTPSSLFGNNTYYYCAIASNSLGTGYGSVLSFKTPLCSAAACTPGITQSILCVQTGLLSAPTPNPNFFQPTIPQTVISPLAPFVPYRIPTYDDLKSIYYTQSKVPKQTIASLPSTMADQTVYLVNGDLSISSSPTGGGTAIVFVEGNLNFTAPNTQFTYGTGTTGLVFVVRGNVNIDQNYTRIDAVIISSGTICTAWNGTSCPSSIVISPVLVINGGLTNLDDTKPIQFKRTLTGNSNSTSPAEVINSSPKYLVILRNLMFTNLQKWSEVIGP